MVEKIEINLIPQEYRVQTRRFTIKKDILIPIAISSVLILAMALWNGFLVSRINSEQAATAKIVQEINDNAHVQIEIESLGREKIAMADKITGLKQINVIRDKWVRLMELYCREVPANTWLTQLQEVESIIKVKGVTMAFGEVGQFMVQLSNNDIVNTVSLHDVKRSGNGNTMSFSIDQELSSSMLSSKPDATN